METKLNAIPAIAVATFLAFSACDRSQPEKTVAITPSPNLLNQEEAIEFLLERIDLGGSALLEVRLLDKMLNSGDTIEEIDSNFRRTSNDYEWFAIIDRRPGAFLSKPLEYVFLKYRTQEIQVTQHSDFPLLNGDPLYPDSAAYHSRHDIIFSNSSSDSEESKENLKTETAAHILNSIAEITPPRMASDKSPFAKQRFAILMSNYDSGHVGEEIAANIENMDTALKTSGYEVVNFVSNPRTEEMAPWLNLKQERNRGLVQLRNFVRKHQRDKNACEEILIYFCGKTDIEETRNGPRAYIPLIGAYAGEDSDRKPDKKFYPEDFADILSGLKSCHINVVIDANHSSSFIKPLLKLSKIETVIASCSSRQYAYTSYHDLGPNGVPDPYGRYDGERGSEFTSGFTKGLIENLNTERSPLSAHEIVAIGYKSAVANDLSFISGMTYPEFAAREKESRCRYGIDD